MANFFDTLGIGSYATSTSMLRLWKVIPDEKIPGTLNVGYVLPTVVQALIYITIVEVEFATLVIIILARRDRRLARRRRGRGVASSTACRSAWAPRCSAPRR